MKKFIPLLLILLSGCTTPPKYNYQSKDSTDPTIIFGDRFGGSSRHAPARSFRINKNDAIANKCADFEFVGAASNNWMKIGGKTMQIKTPAGQAVAIRGDYMYNTGLFMTICTPPTLMFIPKDTAIYSIDIETIQDKCLLSVIQKLPNGQQEKVDGLTALPACKDK